MLDSKNMRQISILILTIGLLTSCNDWLDIEPKTEVDEAKLFKKAEGYSQALNGIYLNMTKNELYGKNLTYHFIEALSQSVETGTSETLQNVSDYNYADAGIQNVVNNIWQNSFNTILNCNNLIDNIRQTELEFDEKEIILGEALTARAIIHFDLLRLFAPTLDKDPDFQIMPYKKHKSLDLQPMEKSSVIMQKVIGDLKEASGLLIGLDSITTVKNNYRRVSDRFKTGTGYDEGRGYKLNYYATQAFLARAFAYNNQLKEAYEIAIKLKEHTLFSYNTQNELKIDLDKRDVKLSKDIMFALYAKNYALYYNQLVITSSLPYSIKDIGSIFPEDEKSDYRYQYLMQIDANNNAICLKHLESEDVEINKNNRAIIPLIRMSEMEYIICEYLANNLQVAEAVKVFNEFRLARGLIKELEEDIEPGLFMKELIRDARKEFMMEGQLWFFYKRLNANIQIDEEIIEVNENYVLPQPTV